MRFDVAQEPSRNSGVDHVASIERCQYRHALELQGYLGALEKDIRVIVGSIIY